MADQVALDAVGQHMADARQPAAGRHLDVLSFYQFVVLTGQDREADERDIALDAGGTPQ